MAKYVKYAMFWFGAVILFNLICFLAPIKSNGFNEGSIEFWIVYSFIMLSLIVHLIFGMIVLNEKNNDNIIQKNTLLYIVISQIYIMITAGLICMATQSIPNWIKIVICYVLLFIFIFFYFASKTVGENTKEANIELNRKTYYFRNLTDKAQELVSIADTTEKKRIAETVYEKIRYSDMISDQRLEIIETDILTKMKELITEYQNGSDIQMIKKTSNELILIVNKRNNECKTLKRQV